MTQPRKHRSVFDIRPVFPKRTKSAVSVQSDKRPDASISEVAGSKVLVDVPLPSPASSASSSALIVGQAISQQKHNLVSSPGVNFTKINSSDRILSSHISFNSPRRISFQEHIGNFFDYVSLRRYSSAAPFSLVFFFCFMFLIFSSIVIFTGFRFFSFSQSTTSFSHYYGGVLSTFSSLVKDSSSVFKRVHIFGAASVSLLEEGPRSIHAIVGYLIDGDGDGLRAYLVSLRDMLSSLDIDSVEVPQFISQSLAAVGVPIDGELSSRFAFDQYRSFIDSLLSWLSSSRPRRIIVLFQNPAEIRPTGGFVGSYAEVVIHNGAISDVVIHDINDVDRTLSTLVTPPKPLQALVGNWRTADANWFVDFPDSASRILQFMEASDLYRKNDITFDGVVALNASVVSDLLSLVGPISLPDNSGVIDSENFLFRIQESVQHGQAQNTESPKGILTAITPIFFEKIKQLDRADLVRLLSASVAHRDIQVYFINHQLQKFFDTFFATGRQFKIPSNFNGEYISVVSSNVGGQKSDLFIKQHVTSRIRINLDGTMTNSISMERTHTASQNQPWWYRSQNQRYVQVFTAPGAKPVSTSGMWNRAIVPKINYVAAGYSTDPLVRNIEDSLRLYPEFPELVSFVAQEKNVFGFWLKTDVDTTARTTLDYMRPLLHTPSDGVSYNFVFERQSGDTGEYTIEISAPIGYIWKHNQRSTYEHHTLDLPVRLNIPLTLERIAD
ncbi:MAG: hypothetical protein RIQ54_68 [Candidatus Parcubacteria bacterium]|jgi:hypothetical protein